MGSRLVPIVLIALLAIVQAQLWFGQGGMPNVNELAKNLEHQQRLNELTRQQVEQLKAEVLDLKEGLNMVEEKARSELGMVKDNEIFVQINP